MLNDKDKACIEKSVLCWLATSNLENEPNVSPKEMFTYQDDQTLLIANIASPKSVNNILENQQVCVSILDVFTQKGLKIKGTARIIEAGDEAFPEKVKYLTDLFTDKFPVKGVIEVTIKRVEKIIAPSYYLFSNTTEEGQIADAMKTYQVKPIE